MISYHDAGDAADHFLDMRDLDDALHRADLRHLDDFLNSSDLNLRLVTNDFLVIDGANFMNALLDVVYLMDYLIQNQGFGRRKG